VRRALPLIALLTLLPATAAAEITAPRGVDISTVASDLPQPSNIAFDESGDIWATSAGYAPRPSDGVWYVPRAGARPRHVVERLLYALGLTWYRDELYVVHAHPYGLGRSHTGRVVAYSGFDGERFARSRVVVGGLPVGLHNADSIVPGPDGRLYLGVGSQTDNRAPSRRLSAAVVSFRPNGRGLRLEGRGFRNPYGLAFVPGTSTLLVSDNGRDDLGLQRPPDELNAIHTPGRARSYGFPRCWGRRGGSCRGSTPPLVNLPPHAAAAGVAVSPDWDGQGPTAFVAQNGSSFPRKPTGSNVVAVRLTPRGAGFRGRLTSFARGFRRLDPVGAAIGPDGALYVTLHKSDRVVRFAPPQRAGARSASARRPTLGDGLAVVIRLLVGWFAP
jgi:glucose/arabinose dehydrogenase